MCHVTKVFWLLAFRESDVWKSCVGGSDFTALWWHSWARSYTWCAGGSIYLYVAAMCVLAPVIYGRREMPICGSMLFVTPGTTR